MIPNTCSGSNLYSTRIFTPDMFEKLSRQYHKVCIECETLQMYSTNADSEKRQTGACFFVRCTANIKNKYYVLKIELFLFYFVFELDQFKYRHSVLAAKRIKMCQHLIELRVSKNVGSPKTSGFVGTLLRSLNISPVEASKLPFLRQNVHSFRFVLVHWLVGITAHRGQIGISVGVEEIRRIRLWFTGVN